VRGDKPQAVVRPEPGVSWINLPNRRYQGPEQRSRKLPKSISRVQHGYGTTRRTTTHATAGHIALQRKLAYLQVPMALRRRSNGHSINS